METRPLNKEIGRIQETEERELRVQVSIPHGHIGISVRRFHRRGKKLYADTTSNAGFWLNEKHLETLITLLQEANGEIRLACQARDRVGKGGAPVIPSVLTPAPQPRRHRPRPNAVPMSNRYEEREIHIDVGDPFGDEEVNRAAWEAAQAAAPQGTVKP